MISYYFKTFIYRFLNFLSPILFLKIQFRRLVGYWPDFKNPKTFNEKNNWLKLYYHNPLLTICADKYEMHNYVKGKGLGKYLNIIYGVWTNANDIDFDKLPQKFVLKPTHSSAKVIICLDKSKLNWKKTKKILNSWLKTNLYYWGLEWAYKNIPPRIICEKLIETPDGRLPIDYKFLCFNGEPKLIYFVSNRTKDGLNLDYYDCNWNHQQMILHGFPNSGIYHEAPKELPTLLIIARKLAKDFPFVRVDFYVERGKILIGELTFYPGSGLIRLHPEGSDERMGSYLNLPERWV